MTVWRNLRDDAALGALGLAVVVLLGAGTLFYLLVENWSLVDAFYFSAMTLATVGFADVVPQTDAGKLFTVGVLSGVGVLAAFVRQIATRERTLARSVAGGEVSRSERRP